LYFSRKYYQCNQIKGDEMSVSCSMHTWVKGKSKVVPMLN